LDLTSNSNDDSSRKIVLHGRKVVGGVAEGEALVTRQTISGWGGIDPKNGTIIETHHELRGQRFSDRVFVFPGAKGGSGGSMGFHRARLAGNVPKAMIFRDMTSRVAMIAIITHSPTVTDLDRDPLEIIQTGDWVRVDADKGIVEVIKRH
jgi:predicted aconitase with swiveling domain